MTEFQKAMRALKEIEDEAREGIDSTDPQMKEYYSVGFEIVEDVKMKFYLGKLSFEEARSDIIHLLDPEGYRIYKEIMSED